MSAPSVDYPEYYHPYYFYSALTVCLLSITAHTVALYAIHLSTKKTNQNLILASLSTVEIIASLHRIFFEVEIKEGLIEDSHAKRQKQKDNIVGLMLDFIHYLIIYVMILIMFVLTADRLVMALSPLKYKIRVSRRRVVVAIVVCWCFGITSGVATSLIPADMKIYVDVFGWFFAAFYLLLVPVTYVIIVHKIRQSRRAFAHAQQPQEGSIKFGKEFLIPTVLIITYIFLFVGPMLMQHFFPWDVLGRNSLTKFVIHSISLLLPLFGTLGDALTYVLLSPHYKQPLKDRLKKLYESTVRCTGVYRGSVNRVP